MHVGRFGQGDTSWVHFPLKSTKGTLISSWYHLLQAHSITRVHSSTTNCKIRITTWKEWKVKVFHIWNSLRKCCVIYQCLCVHFSMEIWRYTHTWNYKRHVHVVLNQYHIYWVLGQKTYIVYAQIYIRWKTTSSIYNLEHLHTLKNGK
jgi:hypothetical protein